MSNDTSGTVNRYKHDRSKSKRAAIFEQNKEKMIALYESGLGTKRICTAMGWTHGRQQGVQRSLNAWGVYIPGRDKGGGASKGIGPYSSFREGPQLPSSRELILSWYRREQRAVEAPERAWADLWSKPADAEYARRKSKEYYYANRESILQKQKVKDANRRTNPAYKAKKNALLKEWKARNKERHKETAKRWLAVNPDKAKAYRRASQKWRRLNPYSKVVHNLRKRVRDYSKHHGHTTLALIGCTSAQLRAHLERKFKRGMSWANYGTHWHVDHIIPCAKFDLTNSFQQQACFHWTNLQPLEAAKNMEKSDKLHAHTQIALPIAA